jgi:hypothetical protein
MYIYFEPELQRYIYGIILPLPLGHSKEQMTMHVESSLPGSRNPRRQSSSDTLVSCEPMVVSTSPHQLRYYVILITVVICFIN